MSAVSSLWYLRSALEAVERADVVACGQALRGFAASEADRLGLAAVSLEHGGDYLDTERAERHQLLVKLCEEIEKKRGGGTGVLMEGCA